MTTTNPYERYEGQEWFIVHKCGHSQEYGLPNMTARARYAAIKQIEQTPCPHCASGEPDGAQCADCLTSHHMRWSGPRIEVYNQNKRCWQYPCPHCGLANIITID